jgi:hypothetical protein
MNENNRTLTYVGLALLSLLLGVEPWRGLGSNRQKVVLEDGKPLFEKLTDPLAVKQMEITQRDADSGDPKQFSVGVKGNRFTLPSKQDYPADAKQHLANAVNGLIGIDILSTVSSIRSEHEMYGVLDPNSAEPGAKGMGVRITMRGDSSKPLADLIVGKAVKDNPKQRYVRRAEQDAVFTVALNVDNFSTKFEDWIEKDLLKLNTFDLRELQIHDYSTNIGVRGGHLTVARKERMDAKLDFDETSSNWKIGELLDKEDNVSKKYELKADEELNTEKLNALKTALGDLKIVDVAHKPESLAQNLKEAEKFVKDMESVQGLMGMGFFVTRGETDDDYVISSTEGDVVCTMKDGVEYVLRFGRIDEHSSVGGDAAEDEKAAAGDKEKVAGKEGEEEEKKPSSLRPNRFVFVSVRFNQDQIAKPKLAELPAEKEGGKKDDPLATKKPDADAKEDKKEDATKDDGDGDDKKQAESERAKIEQENARKLDEYNDKVKKAQEHVAELNERFADWFYVVSDDVYRKIRLSHEDLVKKKKATGEGDTPADLMKLKGLK